MKYEMVRMTQNRKSERTAQVDFVTFIVNHISFVLVISDRHSVEQPTFFKLWTKNHLLSADEYKYFESLPDTKSQIFQWKHFARHSFSLIGGIRLSPHTSKTSESTASGTSRTTDDYRNSPTIKFCADLFCSQMSYKVFKKYQNARA